MRDGEAEARAARFGRVPGREETRRGAPSDAGAPVRAARVHRVRHEVYQHLCELIGIATQSRVGADLELDLELAERVAQQRLDTRAELGDGRRASLDAMRDHAFQS